MTFEELEQTRLEYAKKYKRALEISCVVIIPVGAVLLFMFADSNILMTAILVVVFGLIAGLIIVSIATRKVGQEFEVAYENFFVSGGLSKIFTNIDYSHESGMNRDVVRRVMTTGDRDGVDTFYILDPAFIEKIQNLYEQLKKEICLTFMDGKVYIALNNGEDSFEAPNPLRRLDETAESEKIIGDMKVITDFIDDLDLDHYTIKKSAKK